MNTNNAFLAIATSNNRRTGMSEAKEHPSTYVVQDRSNVEELRRLQRQDALLTQMLGLLPAQVDPNAFRHVLDVGCGTGGWLVHLARAYPHLTRLVGVEVSATMAEAARAHAQAQQVAERLQIYVMDALRMLEFRNGSFDLVHQRLGFSYLRTWDWPKVLSEYVRVCRPGGVVCVTECDLVTSNSVALTTVISLFGEVLYQAGHLVTATDDGITRALPGLLERGGMREVQQQTHALHFQGGTEDGNVLVEDMALSLRTMRPFLHKWIRLPEDYDERCHQAIQEMQQPEFAATWRFVTVWGKV